MYSYDIRLTPSILNAYSYWQQAQGEEWEDNAFEALIAALSHTPGVASMEADRGTALNNICDSLLLTGEPPLNNGDTWGDKVGDRLYSVDPLLCQELLRHLQAQDAGSVQTYSSALITTLQGVRVKLYGYADYVATTGVIDLKTTKSYSYGKYRHGWQHIVYPYTLIQSGLLDRQSYDGFVYLVAEVDTTPEGIITGSIYEESYFDTFGDCKTKLIDYLDGEVLPFICQHRDELRSSYIFD